MGVIPAFAIEGGLPLALVRGAWAAALLAALGTLLFMVLVAPRALGRADDAVRTQAGRRLLGLARVELAAALLAAPAWLVAQAADMTGAAGLGAASAASPTVLAATTFGRLLLLQWGALAAAALVLGRGASPVRSRAAAGLATLATLLQVGHEHAWSMYGRPSWLLLSGMLHLLSAAAWLGGLPPLLLMVQGMPPRVAAAAARWFSPLGKWCVGGIVLSSTWQFWELIGGLPGVVGTAYGWVASAKLCLLAVLLGFAAGNRYRLAPALLRAEPFRARRALAGSIAVQTGFGLLTVAAAAVLSELPPSLHEQPTWPFPLRPSLAALADPDLAREVSNGLLLLAAALLLALLALAWRRGGRLRLLAVPAALVLTWLALPHLDLLLVEAYPTSFYRSPTGFAAASIVQGAALYPTHCAACHGADGRGDGPAARTLPVPPADLTAAHLWEHADGEMFWWISHGMEAPEGGAAMPGFAGQLDDDARWALIDYVRGHNAGVGMRDAGLWPHPVPSPGFALSCAGGRITTTAELRGHVLHVIAVEGGDAAIPPAPPMSVGAAAVTTVLLTRGAASAPGPDACVAADPAAWEAYAVIAGVAPDALAGTQFLVDPDGWMRAEQRRDGVTRWSDPAALLADMRAICTHPIAEASGSGHVHH